MANKFPLKEIESRFKRVLQYAPAMLGNDAVNFFKDSFKRQGWLGSAMEPWKPRKAMTKWGPTKRNNGRAILVDTGRLRRSIRLISASNLTATIGTDVPYAKAHNEGSRGIIIQTVRRHTRKVNVTATIGTSSRIKRVQTGVTNVRQHTRRINQNLPRRQFMGNSPYLQKQLQRRLTAELMKALR